MILVLMSYIFTSLYAFPLLFQSLFFKIEKEYQMKKMIWMQNVWTWPPTSSHAANSISSLLTKKSGLPAGGDDSGCSEEM